MVNEGGDIMCETRNKRVLKATGQAGGIRLPVLVVILFVYGVATMLHAGDDGQHAAAKVATLSRLLTEMEVRADRLQEQLADRDRQLREAMLVREGRAMREVLSETEAAGPSLAWSLNDAGLLLMAEGHMQEAARLFERALVNIERHFDPVHPARGTLLQNAAESLLGQGDAKAAESRYREAALVFGTAAGDQHPRLAAVLNGWATALARLQKFEDAETLYRRSILIYEGRKKPRTAELAVPLHNLALMLLARGRADEAGELLERALQTLRQAGAGESDSALLVLRALVRQCRATGALEPAARYEQEAGTLAVKRMERATGTR